MSDNNTVTNFTSTIEFGTSSNNEYNNITYSAFNRSLTTTSLQTYPRDEMTVHSGLVMQSNNEALAKKMKIV